jgi:hypothetical protein
METREMYQLARWYRNNVVGFAIEDSLIDAKTKTNNMMLGNSSAETKRQYIRGYLNKHI